MKQSSSESVKKISVLFFNRSHCSERISDAPASSQVQTRLPQCPGRASEYDAERLVQHSAGGRRNQKNRERQYLIHIIRKKATAQQIEQMLAELDPIIKLAVDIDREILAGGGAMHADCEATLIEDGSCQENIWGANWIPDTQSIEFEALINIRPKQRNLSMTIQDAGIRKKIESISRKLMERV